MEITKTLEGRTMRIVLKGKLNTLTAPLLEAELPPDMEGVDRLELDMTELEYLSSAGLRVILAARRSLDERGTVVIHGESEDVHDVFEVTGFGDILEFE